ncbi:DNA polymerase-4 [Volucribacter psittacicida]|uniref:DNA polymerase IV n=1 Tax=Volucribacter psittacicida TaxID=203482 RepID=A0A4V2PCM0_9PAST|nr:DNA polymerase IV [Volucribacter psittacicida]TCK01736.1 DNA polymerase-4 [Volucribacter psittacicida]
MPNIPTYRKIIHIDMDCFYAAIEMRENPTLVGKPIAVGRKPEQRGVLTTCNYEARKFGLHSAMSSAEAIKRCPQLILVPPNFPLYRQVSQQIHQIFQQYTHLIEPLSLDEAYLDVTECRQHSGSATWIAEAIREQIANELKLTASAGIAPLKFLAKIASDKNKPNGQYLISPNDMATFIKHLPLSALPGVGKVTTHKLKKLGLITCADIQQTPRYFLLEYFGKFGQQIWNFSHGIDERAVKPPSQPKSLGTEMTLLENIAHIQQALPIIKQLYQKLKQRLAKYPEINLQKKYKLGIKLKFEDFQLTTLEKNNLIFSQAHFQQLLEKIWARRKDRKIRLIGLHIQLTETKQQQQMSLW